MVREEEDEVQYVPEMRNFHLLRSENELFDENSNKSFIVISARRVKLPKNGENWEILENNKVVLILKGTRFTNNEKSFLHSVEGMKFLVSEYKNGSSNVVKIKEKMKKII